jgi:hypothetical protein
MNPAQSDKIARSERARWQKKTFALDSINDYERATKVNLFSNTTKPLIDHPFSPD